MSIEDKASKLLTELITVQGGKPREPQEVLTRGMSKVMFEGRPLLVEAPTGVGKALALDTPVPTPNGWKTMGELKAFDLLYGSDGSITRIKEAFDVLYGRKCYKLRFLSGAEIIADEGHEWTLRNGMTLTTKQMFENHEDMLEITSNPVLADNGSNDDESMYLRGIEAFYAGEVFEDVLTLSARSRSLYVEGLKQSLGDEPFEIPENLKSQTLDFFRSTGHFVMGLFDDEYEYSSMSYDIVTRIVEWESVPVRCISVEAEDKLFLVGKNMVATHNSFSSLAAVRALEAPAIISTHTHALENQLFRDATRLSEATGEFKTAMLNGRNAYLCLNKLDGLKADELTEIQDWAATTDTGEKAHYPGEISKEDWNKVSTTAQACLGSECVFYKQCFAEQAKTQASQADLLITNHSVMGQAIRSYVERDQAFMKGRFQNIVFDEAHELAPVIGEAFGCRITSSTMKYLHDRSRIVSSVKEQQYFLDMVRRVDSRSQREALRHIDQTGGLKLFENMLRCLSEWHKRIEAGGKKWSKTKKLFEDVIGDLELCLRPDNNARTSWLEWDSQGFVLRSTLFNPGRVIQQGISAFHGVTFMSATLRVAGAFKPEATRLGFKESEEYAAAVIPPVFDYTKQGRVLLCDEMPLPSDVNYYSILAKKYVAPLTKTAKGRTLVLCTSWRGVTEMHKLLKQMLSDDIKVLRQEPGVNVKNRAEEFDTNHHTVLVGTMSLWTGMSFEGNTSVITVIDKVPFPHVNDPIIAARIESIEQNLGPGAGFSLESVPEACRKIGQGGGRAIRTVNDYAIIVMADPRVNSKSAHYKSSYGKRVLKSLPPMPITHSVIEAADFIKSIPGL